jgi:purine-binding chemotaxis protein CheW
MFPVLRAFDKLQTFWGEHVDTTLGRERNLTVLVFELDGHRYGLDASEVKEILRAARPSRLAQQPGVVEGILNVRGRVAAVLDLRARFGLTQREIVPSDVLLLCETEGRLLALRADAAIDLVQIAASELAMPSEVTPAALYARGVCRLSGGLLFLCDLSSFLREAELLALDQALAQAQNGEPLA